MKIFRPFSFSSLSLYMFESNLPGIRRVTSLPLDVNVPVDSESCSMHA